MELVLYWVCLRPMKLQQPSQTEEYVGFSIFNRKETEKVNFSGRIAKDLHAFLETSMLSKEETRNVILNRRDTYLDLVSTNYGFFN